MKRASTALILETRRKNSEGTHVVRLRITHNREQKYYSLPIKLSPDDWENVRTQNPKIRFKNLSLELNKIEIRAKELIDSIPYFTFEEFEKRFNQNPKGNNDIETYYHAHIDTLYNTNKVGSAIHYTTSVKSVLLFQSSQSKKHYQLHRLLFSGLKNIRRGWKIEVVV